MRKTPLMMVALVASNLALAEAQYSMGEGAVPDDSDQPVLNSTLDTEGVVPGNDQINQQPSTDPDDHE
ncbi:MAG: hypothetical protein ACRDD3_08990 [Azovibrio sp.]